MQVRRTNSFERALDRELSEDGRPSRVHFESQLAGAVILTLSAFWGDPTLVPLVDAETGVRSVFTAPVPPNMFPPGTFYAVQVDDVIELLDVEFDWDFWENTAYPED